MQNLGQSRQLWREAGKIRRMLLSLRPRLLRSLCTAATAASLLIASAANAVDFGADNKSAQVTPKGLYHRVWQLVQDRYYDSSFNGQNWSRWEHRYDARLKDMDDARLAIRTMLSSLGDQYTRYLDPTAFDGEKQQIEAKLSGIGIQMGFNQAKKLAIVAPIEGSPALKAGLMSKDEILEIDGKSTKGMSVEEASKRIRGQVGTDVTLTIVRKEDKRTFKVTRDEIPIRSVMAVKMLTNDIGYIRLNTFMSERANEEMREALDKLSPARGVIIDLRGNPGGLVTNALDICSMFLDGGIIVSTLDRTNKMQSARATGHPITKQTLVVLIDGGSASASEITSGALHDSERAQLVGEKSFGKGLVQSITRLEDNSGVNITIARYVTPNNIDINKKGITPDFEVKLSQADFQSGKGPWYLYRDGKLTEDTKDVQLKKAIDVISEKMANAQAPFELKLNPFPNAEPQLDFGLLPKH